jgi:pimeloyl-ACP methyl ester carboxylesterase
MPALLEDAAFVISELDMGNPVVAGHSWGATVALELAGTRHGIASGLVFIQLGGRSANHAAPTPPLCVFRGSSDCVKKRLRRDMG